uniref:RNA polymerase sigma factor n=1 Tax=Roseihalotalea indica TaxID=2867963 RepID=A0AA49GTI2_9BACT|nr:RNA polymerase sigma-70 factor [Tunicatimonas sp. TK19036]
MVDEDKIWVKALRNGKPEGLNNLFQKYHHALYFHALDLLKSPQAAEDVVQEVFIKVWEKRAQLKPELSFKSYLFTISRNHILNQLKRLSLDWQAKQHFSDSHIGFHNQVEEQVIYADYEAIAQKALAELSPKRKMVFTLHRVEGKKYDEIATLLNISKNTVRDHVVKAEKSIKEYFACQADITISLFLAITLGIL